MTSLPFGRFFPPPSMINHDFILPRKIEMLYNQWLNVAWLPSKLDWTATVVMGWHQVDDSWFDEEGNRKWFCDYRYSDHMDKSMVWNPLKNPTHAKELLGKILQTDYKTAIECTLWFYLGLSEDGWEAPCVTEESCLEIAKNGELPVCFAAFLAICCYKEDLQELLNVITKV